jgi:hypothetical protein
MNIKQSTQNFMVYGELRRYPLNIIIQVRIMTYWGKLLTYPNTLAYKLHYIMKNTKSLRNYKFKLVDVMQKLVPTEPNIPKFTLVKANCKTTFN